MRTRIQRFGLPLFVGCISVSSSLHFPGTQRREDNHNPSNHNPIPTKENEDNHNNHGTMNKALSTTARCTCGKVQFAIQTLEQSPPLRLVCYCSDCRGYYETLDRLAIEKSLPPSAILDSWGGVDWTALYPRDITILKGKEHLKTTIIRPTSSIRQVYASCCHTPMFRFGEMSMLMNSNLIPPDEKSQIPVDFRIIGRDSWKEGGAEQPKKPSISWSIPFRWLWVMPQHIRKDLMTPLPFDLPSTADAKEGKVDVLKGFQKGSK